MLPPSTWSLPLTATAATSLRMAGIGAFAIHSPGVVAFCDSAGTAAPRPASTPNAAIGPPKVRMIPSPPPWLLADDYNQAQINRYGRQALIGGQNGRARGSRVRGGQAARGDQGATRRTEGGRGAGRD